MEELDLDGKNKKEIRPDDLAKKMNALKKPIPAVKAFKDESPAGEKPKEEHHEKEKKETPIFVGKAGMKAHAEQAEKELKIKTSEPEIRKEVEGELEVFTRPKKPVAGQPIKPFPKPPSLEQVKPPSGGFEKEKIRKAALESLKAGGKSLLEEKKEEHIRELEKLIPPMGKKRKYEELNRYLKERLSKPQHAGVGKQFESVTRHFRDEITRGLGGLPLKESDLADLDEEEEKKARELVKRLQPSTKQYAPEEIKAAMLLEGVPKNVCEKVMYVLYRE